VEEGVGFELRGAVLAADAVLVVADETESILLVRQYREGWGKGDADLLMKCSASGPSCWSGGKLRWRGQSTILR
jgi:hypothetical protein